MTPEIILAAKEFVNTNPFITWCALWLVWLVAPLTNLVFTFVIGRPMRFLLVALRGWPPVHLDADGDFKKPDEITEEHNKLRAAVRRLYYAAHWSPDRPVPDAQKLWEDVRDAAGLQPGATARILGRAA